MRLVQDPELGEVAVKHPTRATADALERFRREIELQSELDHPNIVEVLDFDLSNSSLWYAMPCAVANLAQLIRSTDWDDATIVGLFQDVLAGVGHAHGKHVLHRDLKPENVLIYFENNAPVAKVSDFGLGRRFTRDEMTFQTRTAYAAGSDFYTAPEQWGDFKETTEAADVYSLGRILQLILSIRESIAITSPHLVECVQVATRPDPFERYQSVEQFAVAVVPASLSQPAIADPRAYLSASVQDFLESPSDSIAIDRLMDGLEKSGQDASSCRVVLGSLPDQALKLLSVKHAGRLRPLLLRVVTGDQMIPVDSALTDLHVQECILDVAVDDRLRGIALFGMARLASIYQMDEFVEPAAHRLYTEGHHDAIHVLRGLLDNEKSVLGWMKSALNMSKIPQL